MRATTGENLILVGRFGAAQGVRGEVRVKSFTQDPMALASYGPLTDGAGRNFTLLRARVLREDMLVASVEGVSDRDTAQALTGTDLYARRENLPAPDEDEVYVADLIGLEALTPAGERIGTVQDVLNFGAGDILEVAPEKGDTLLFPFTKAVVPVVDVPARKLVICLPEDAEAANTPGAE